MQILAEPDRVALGGRLGGVSRHRLSAPAVVIGIDAPVRVRAERLLEARAVLIRPGCWHSIDGDADTNAGRRAVFLLPPHALRSDQLDWAQELAHPGRWLELGEALLARDLTSWEPIDRCLAREQLTARPIDDRLRSAIAALAGALDENRAVGEIAAAARLSPSRLMALAHAQLGTSLRAYRRWLRAFRVVRDYAAGLSLTEAAFAAGFASSPHLSFSAREQFGIRPSDILRPANRATIRVISEPLSVPGAGLEPARRFRGRGF
jgi:AraC-like DNA-binding protein